MDEIGSTFAAFGGMIVPFTIVVNVLIMNVVIMNMVIMNMQGQHASMGLAQDMNDGRTVGTRKRDRWAKNTKRIGGNQQGCPQRRSLLVKPIRIASKPNGQTMIRLYAEKQFARYSN